jgi:hypothetical protein
MSKSYVPVVLRSQDCLIILYYVTLHYIILYFVYLFNKKSYIKLEKFMGDDCMDFSCVEIMHRSDDDLNLGRNSSP